MFSYSVKSPEWRWQWRRADLQHFEIFRHGPIIIYTRLPAGGTYYPICAFPMSSESLIGISNAFSAVCLGVSVIFPTCSLYPQQKHAYSVLHLQAWPYIYTGPCLKALTECSPLGFQRLSIASLTCTTPQIDQMLYLGSGSSVLPVVVVGPDEYRHRSTGTWHCLTACGAFTQVERKTLTEPAVMCCYSLPLCW